MAVGGSSYEAVRSYVALGKEGTFGTYASATTAVEALSCSIKTEIETKKLEGISTHRGYHGRVMLAKEVKGSLEQYFHPQESVLLFANTLGGPISTGAGASAGIGDTTTTFVHSISTGNFDTTASINQLSFNVRKGQTLTWRYTGGKVNNLKLTGKVGEPIKATYDLIFKDSTQQSDDIATSLSVSSVMPFTFVHGTYRYANTETSVSTTTAAEPIQSFELSIKNNIVTKDAVRSLGTDVVDILPATRREIEFKITNRFDTTTTYQRFIQGTSGSVELYFAGDAIGGTGGIAKFQSFIRMPKVYYKAGDVDIKSAEELLTTEIPFDVVVDYPSTATGKDIGVTFINTTASY